MNNTVNKIYHAAIYVRLSKEDGDVAGAGKAESNSISNQKNLIKDFLKEKEDIIVVSERVVQCLKRSAIRRISRSLHSPALSFGFKPRLLRRTLPRI